MYTPTHLKEWEHPDSYFGATWYGWYPVLGRHRESSILDNVNFEVALERLGPLSTEIDAVAHGFPSGDVSVTDSVYVIRESHWAVGWAEWIGVHESNEAALRVADEIAKQLDDYQVLDEDRWSEAENDAAYKYWEEESLAGRVSICQESGVSVFQARRPDQMSDRVYDYVREIVSQ